MVKNREINGTEEIALVTPTPGHITLSSIISYDIFPQTSAINVMGCVQFHFGINAVLAKPPLKFNGPFAKLGLTSSVKINKEYATGGINNVHVRIIIDIGCGLSPWCCQAIKLSTSCCLDPHDWRIICEAGI